MKIYYYCTIYKTIEVPDDSSEEQVAKIVRTEANKIKDLTKTTNEQDLDYGWDYEGFYNDDDDFFIKDGRCYIKEEKVLNPFDTWKEEMIAETENIWHKDICS